MSATSEPYTGPVTGEFDASVGALAALAERRARQEVALMLPPYTGPRTGDMAVIAEPGMPPWGPLRFQLKETRSRAWTTRSDSGSDGASCWWPFGWAGAGSSATAAVIVLAGAVLIRIFFRRAADDLGTTPGHPGCPAPASAAPAGLGLVLLLVGVAWAARQRGAEHRAGSRGPRSRVRRPVGAGVRLAGLAHRAGLAGTPFAVTPEQQAELDKLDVWVNVPLYNEQPRRARRDPLRSSSREPGRHLGH